MKSLVLGNILSKIWAIDPAYAQGQIPLLINMHEGKVSKKDFASRRAALRPFAYNISSESKETFAAAPAGSVAVINLVGPLMKNDQECGPEGTASIICDLREANANPNITAIVLNIDSPGGTVDGTETFANEIKKSAKPVIAFVDGCAASAAYWIASACSLIIINGETAAVGSIGTMTSFFDYLPFFKAQGIEFHEIYATESFNKNIEYSEALKGNNEPMKINILNPLNKVFTTTVDKNRGPKLDTTNDRTLSGGIFYGKAAIKAGLADEIGSFDYAVKKAMELSNGPSNNSSTKATSENMKLKLNSKMVGLLAKFNITLGEGQSEVEKEITPEELADITEKAEGYISATELAAIAISEKEVAESKVGSLTEALAKATTDHTAIVTELQTKLTEANAQIAKYEKVDPGAQVNNGSEKPLGEQAEDKANKYLTSTDIEKKNRAEKAAKSAAKLKK